VDVVGHFAFLFMINRECPRAIRNAWARALTAEAVRPRSSAMLDSEGIGDDELPKSLILV
jgi:hypothetical protein